MPKPHGFAITIDGNDRILLQAVDDDDESLITLKS